ncbi:MAG: response regulator [Candidatus Abyssobacteria bacterium SURF_5]|uniref:Response regulator n=1 Tax=Abyssobacteria bacterium (strain SURF_5) TaxID=2093360 RepID=A0A3A4N9T6_ABYX5|nr:MAG: response regulator [Candidatus Abyssubacteria bacterium SURF_5]
MRLLDIIILLVEDDDIVRRQMARLLQADGYKILQAARGDDALTLLDHEDVDLVLSDWKMPGMDGVGVLNYVRTHHPDVPVALVTAYPEGLEQFKPDAILVKPFNADQLRQLIRTLTHKQKA